MSFLHDIGGVAGGANAADSGLGHLLGADPSRISTIADRIGTGMNGIAAAGGAAPGYAAEPAPVNNHLQLMDPKILQAIYAKFGGNNGGGGPAFPGYAQ